MKYAHDLVLGCTSNTDTGYCSEWIFVTRDTMGDEFL